MFPINRLLTNICSDDLPSTKAFYTKLFDFEVDFDSGWFVHLISKDKQLELGIMDRNSDLVPEAFRTLPAGFYLTFVVPDVDEVHSLAVSEGMDIVQPPADTFYGQRRMLLKDPNGALVDVSSMMG